MPSKRSALETSSLTPGTLSSSPETRNQELPSPPGTRNQEPPSSLGTRNQEPGTLKGVTLIELVVVIVLLTVGLVVTLRPIWQSKYASVQLENYNRAYTLGQDLMEEILSKKWDHELVDTVATSAQVDCPPNPCVPPGCPPCPAGDCSCTLGAETDESRNGVGGVGNRFNDIDDYDGMNSLVDGCPPAGFQPNNPGILDHTCAAVTYYDDFRQRVTVCYGSSSNFNASSGAVCFAPSNNLIYNSSAVPHVGNADLKYVSVRISWGGTSKDESYIDLLTLVANR